MVRRESKLDLLNRYIPLLVSVVQNGYSRVDWRLGGEAPRKHELQRREGECDKVEEYDDPKPHYPST